MLPMLKTVLGNLFSPKATRLYPAETRELPGYRGELVIDIDACVYCGACARVCPARCLSVDIKANLISSDPYTCVYCGMCAEECPTAAIDLKARHLKPAILKEQISQRGEKKSKEQITELRKRKK